MEMEQCIIRMEIFNMKVIGLMINKKKIETVIIKTATISLVFKI